ncbi:cold shock domain-containing protein [Glaesserella parasuis]|uniref:cold shock domain-containing protein n=1 Tax=Glaesserella parasuis TaxID=738 RepID=UPI001365EE91|nr:cold shock domain-containing protein [Glaesserella parasuis]MDG6410894.1 cold shock domain-containing protein [Glaesserella parasuis]MDO9781648.1 cold shock domain-containing protein [Glaesserella parasuis]MDO9827809.1 cold shock domain-containing protein [Glaesserella parasuis]MDO9856104.1 cold shock domain-containing protein [Glaesserella parasuis]MDO9858495.1 cold shock domain-containing protein [Glaesserella parasuis]
MSGKVISKIKTLDEKKRSGFIYKVTDISEKDFYFRQNSLIGVTFEELSKGIEVKFTPIISEEGVNFANEIELLTPIGVQQSKIKYLNQEKENGFISSIDGQKDIYFNKANLVLDLSFSDLHLGDTVYFEIRIGKDGFLSAINVSKTKESETKNSISIQNTISNIVKTIRDNAYYITDPYVFEDYCFMIIKLLGLTDAYQYPRVKQAGNADGFFKIKALEVLYDCTLSEFYHEYKKDQIENYIGKLNKTQITIDKKEISLNTTNNKQVWIITKGNTKIIKDSDNILVKEIDLNSLIDILEERLSNLGHDSLMVKLQELGE